MDESWRMTMGMSSAIPNVPRRKSTEETSRRTKALNPEDFDDVFGGPPRTVLSRQFSVREAGELNLFYEDIFRKPQRFTPAEIGGRSLPEFRIPASGGGGGGRMSDEFYGDIFGKDSEEPIGRRSRSRSKSNSSSVLSSEDISPFRPPLSVDDDSVPVFASMLRPINVHSKWNASTVMHDVRQQKKGMQDFSCSRPSFAENEHIKSFKSTNFGFSRRVSSPETKGLNPSSYGSVKVSVEDVELNSPSSFGSSLCQEQESKGRKIQDEILEEEEDDDDDDDDDCDEVMSSFVIEINSDHKEKTDKASVVDEAIAWAKGKFQSHGSLEDWSMRQHEKELSEEESETPGIHFTGEHVDGHGSPHLQMKEMALLDEDIRLWSSGKERHIQMLLSTLHDVLWPGSGWYPVPLTTLNDSSNVKRAYQKARLCLHPDKMQQRGATLLQKYIADKAFPILQDAWATFISQDVNNSAGG